MNKPVRLSCHNSYNCKSQLRREWQPLFFIPLQYTISGKKVEVAVKQVIAGREVAQRGAFSNPDSLDLYKNIPELQNY